MLDQIETHDRPAPEDDAPADAGESLDRQVDETLRHRDTNQDTDEPTGSITNMESQYGTQGFDTADQQDRPEVDPFESVPGGNAPARGTENG